MSAINNYFLCVGKNSGSFACEVVARVLEQANVPECAVGILFLSLILFTVVVFLALAVTARLCDVAAIAAMYIKVFVMAS